MTDSETCTTPTRVPAETTDELRDARDAVRLLKGEDFYIDHLVLETLAPLGPGEALDHERLCAAVADRIWTGEADRATWADRLARVSRRLDIYDQARRRPGALVRRPRGCPAPIYQLTRAGRRALQAEDTSP